MTLFAPPRTDVRFEDCDFYHSVEIADRGVIHGQWDLRNHVDEYLGGYSFAGKRVLEIGPASGFLTFEMERRGADVVALEVSDDPGWDFVPYPDEAMMPILVPRRHHMGRLKNSFWFLHQHHRSKARLHYGDACAIPNDIGTFDVAVMAAVLLHCERPVRILAECAKRADALIVTEPLQAELEGQPIVRLAPTQSNFNWHTWWEFSSDFFRQYFGVIGFPHTAITLHQQRCLTAGRHIPFFTVIGSR